MEAMPTQQQEATEACKSTAATQETSMQQETFRVGGVSSSPARQDTCKSAGSCFSVKTHIDEVQEEKQWMTTTVLSRDYGEGKFEKIMRYDLKKLVRYSAFFTILSKGTVFTMDRTAIVNVLITCGVFVASCLATFLLTLGQEGKLEELDTQPLKDLSTSINALVPFVLALYLALTIKRWWALRVHSLGSIFDALTNVCMMISCELHESKWEAVRTQVAKFGLASIELLVQAARHKPKDVSDEALQHCANLKALVQEGLLTTDEGEALRRQDVWERPMMCWAWILRICLSAMDYNHTPHSRSSQVMRQCVMAREGMAVMNMYLDTQLPFGYVHLITLLVNVQNMMMGVKGGIVFAQALSAGMVFLMIEQVLTLVIIVFLYQGMLQISYVIADPFGDDILDFPIRGFMKYVATTVDAMFEAQADCPVVAQDGTLRPPKNRRKLSAPTPTKPATCEQQGKHAVM